MICINAMAGKDIKEELTAITVLEKLSLDCSSEERNRFIKFAERQRRAENDARFSPMTIDLLRDLNSSFVSMRPQLESLQLQQQLMPCIGIAFIAACLAVGLAIEFIL